MTYDFDKPTRRQGTNSYKWDDTPSAGNPSETGKDIIPMWVADMDFEVAPCITNALRKRIDHAIFGYTYVPESYYEAVANWYERRHEWHVERDWILYTSGVVPALSCAVKALTMPGERVIVLTPVYNCFFSSIRNNGCEVAEVALKTVVTEVDSSAKMSGKGYSYEVDFEAFERTCADPKTTLFVLCNPHNPAGRVWTRGELQQMGDICRRHHVRIVSDEIHCELVMPGHKFVPFGTIMGNEDVVLCSPSKSFNTAGLQIANIICRDAETRRRIDRAININEVCDVNPFGVIALQAAYNEGEPWLRELNAYIWKNYCDLRDFFAREMPRLRVYNLEGTYLVWVDITATNLNSDDLTERLWQEKQVLVSSGTIYGKHDGEGFIRLNIACPRARMMEGLERISSVVNAI